MGSKHIGECRLLRIKSDPDHMVTIVDRLDLGEKFGLVLWQQECLILSTSSAAIFAFIMPIVPGLMS